VRLAIAAAHATLLAALLAWSWRKWPDPLVDFGRELYLPWQITRGRVLYRDIASLFGPLSPYVNALWFRLFGVSLMTLAWCNVVVFAAALAGIYHLIRVSTDRVTATAAGLTTLLLFGFSQYVSIGNYNFVTPYSHEATYGFALAVAALVCLQRALTTQRLRWWALGGIAFGSVALTKPEILVASAFAVTVGILAATMAGAGEWRAAVRGTATFVLAAVLPSAAFLSYFTRFMPLPEALRAVGGAWTAIGADVAANAFYARGMGLDDPAANAWRMAMAFSGFIAYILAAALVAQTRIWRVALLAVGILLVPWGTFPRALPLIAATTLVAAVRLVRTSRDARDRVGRHVTLAMWSAFALALLAKMVLNARIAHYGFYLALPATVTTIALVCSVIPEWIAGTWGTARALGFRHIMAWTIVAAAAPYVGLSYGWYAMKQLPVAAGGDRFFAAVGPDRWEGAAVADAVAALGATAPADATIAVLPEGVMINYLLRRESPLRVVNFMPPESMAFGEDAIVQSLEAAPPDFIVLVRKDTSEYGYPAFGADARYGSRTLAWVRERYVPWRRIGDGAIEIVRRSRS